MFQKPLSPETTEGRVNTETGRVISAREYSELRDEIREEYAALPKRLSRAAQRLLDRGDRYPTQADPELLAHAAKLRRKRQRLEKQGRRASRTGGR